jgi:hypothetical protein
LRGTEWGLIVDKRLFQCLNKRLMDTLGPDGSDPSFDIHVICCPWTAKVSRIELLEICQGQLSIGGSVNVYAYLVPNQ